MADYAYSVLATGQTMVAEQAAKPEMRHQSYNISKILKDNAPALFLPGEIEKLSTSTARTLEAYAFTKSATDAITAKSATHTAAAFGDTQKMTVTFSTIGQEFKTGLAMADNNKMTYQEMWNNRYMSAWIHIMDTLETAGYTFLNTYRTQVAPSTDAQFGTWDGSNYLWSVPNADRQWYWQYIAGVLADNNYDQVMDIINTNGGQALARQYMNQGQSNGTNTSFQFDNMTLYGNKNVAAFSTAICTSFAIPMGTAGIVFRNDQLNRANHTSRIQTYTTVTDPFGFGITADLHFYETAASTSGNNGKTQDEVIEWELTLQYAINKAPLSSGSPIHKFVLEA
jgi:hypothetical protein